MWIFDTSPVEQMHNLKTRIKRRKQTGQNSNNNGHASSSNGDSGNSAGGSSKVEGEWQFVNFNPFVYRGSSESKKSSPSSTLEQSTNSRRVHTEDYYEFPTSTKLVDLSPQKREISGKNNENQVNRRSLNSAFDLLKDNEISASSNNLVEKTKKYGQRSARSFSGEFDLPRTNFNDLSGKRESFVNKSDFYRNIPPPPPPLPVGGFPSKKKYSLDSNQSSAEIVAKDLTPPKLKRRTHGGSGHKRNGPNIPLKASSAAAILLASNSLLCCRGDNGMLSVGNLCVNLISRWIYFCLFFVCF